MKESLTEVVVRAPLARRRNFINNLLIFSFNKLYIGTTDQIVGEPPKLENFLGGGRNTTCTGSGEIGSSGELGSIAAEFLSGFPTDHQQLDSGGGLDMVTATAVPEAETRKMPETFGQRTSIYRGVTRYYIFQYSTRPHVCTYRVV